MLSNLYQLKPFFYILDFFYGILGNMGWAILLFAAILRLLMFPIASIREIFVTNLKNKKVRVITNSKVKSII